MYQKRPSAHKVDFGLCPHVIDNLSAKINVHRDDSPGAGFQPGVGVATVAQLGDGVGVVVASDGRVAKLADGGNRERRRQRRRQSTCRHE